MQVVPEDAASNGASVLFVLMIAFTMFLISTVW